MTLWAEEFGKRVRLLRRAAGIDQRQLAGRIGRDSGDVIGRIESARAEGIPVGLLEILADLALRCGYDAAWVLTGKAAHLTAEDLATADRDWLLEEMARLSADLTLVHSMLMGRTKKAGSRRPQAGGKRP